jgi:antitoxin ParD1/3/4
MTSLNIQIPEHLKQFAEREASAKGMANLSEYLQSLLTREERRRVALEDLEAKLVEGLAGPPIVADEAYWAHKRADLLRTYGKTSE